ncbi:MAG TPA: efflux RND transporter periplasmic adaptor subunit [Blastocatellia bacterium]|nr:efflux RND transporter periplasmic adaptor subunit [Blastocatellia bacterium]
MEHPIADESISGNEQPASSVIPSTVTRRRMFVGIISALLLAGAAFSLFVWQQGGRHREPPKTATDLSAVAATPQANSSPDLVTASEKELQQITVEPVIERTIDIERETTGKVAFNEDRITPVIAPYAGRVIELLVGKGELVKAGQPLMVIESPELVTAVNDLAAARTDADKARIALEAAQKAAERARRLHEREAISTRELQQTETELSRAREDLRRAEAAVAVVENRLALFGKERQEIEQLETRGITDPDRRVTLRAPIAGTVIERKVGLGQYVKPDTPDPLFLIADLSTLWVLADVYESFLPQIRVGSPVEISVAAFPERSFPARISFISPTVDPATRTVRVRCVVPNSGNLLKPDMFAKIRIGAAVPQLVPVVPSSAILAQNNTFLVFVEEAHGRFRQRQVSTGRDLQGLTVIEAGLKPGERVATHGVLLLSGLAGRPPDNQTEGKPQ